MNFSQRMGLAPAIKAFQKDSMDANLRNSLWNAFDQKILPWFRTNWALAHASSTLALSRHEPNSLLFVPLWVSHFKWQLSTLPESAAAALSLVERHYGMKMTWNEVYEFVEFVGNLEGDSKNPKNLRTEEFRSECNAVMEREFSAYRFVGKTISSLTNESEIKAIEEAASMDNSALRPVSEHIQTALKKLSDRNEPDYRNSIKESISAVESLCQVIAGERATLGDALKLIKSKVELHPALAKGFSSIYGWTSDEGGKGRRRDLQLQAHLDAGGMPFQDFQ
jgi:hypothetical protein